MSERNDLQNSGLEGESGKTEELLVPAEEIIHELFIPVSEVNIFGEVAKIVEGVKVELLGNQLSDGSVTPRLKKEMGIRVITDSGSNLLKFGIGVSALRATITK